MSLVERTGETTKKIERKKKVGQFKWLKKLQKK